MLDLLEIINRFPPGTTLTMLPVEAEDGKVHLFVHRNGTRLGYTDINVRDTAAEIEAVAFLERFQQ